ncbi:tape measure protein [Empedobacter sp. GD03797]|uniref:tape measure protein n=1 Tax=Empedobacter sp. GD03797 TaxID=2975382 RepID=UPI00244D27AB|nr:tape measure protein [Empedobacter sp. GD03797]MDH1883952.1 tape measure protein [Empedobacter sp. GD03797]
MAGRSKLEILLELSDRLFNNALSRAQNRINSTVNSAQQRLNSLRLPNIDTSQIENLNNSFNFGLGAGIGMEVMSMAVNGIKELSGEAIDAVDSLTKFEQTMQFGGFNSSAIAKARGEVKKYADDTVYDLQTIANTTAQLAANGVQNYSALTQAAGNLNAVAGGNADTYKSVALVLTQANGAGKLVTQDWNQLANAIPGASGKIQEALRKNGAFTGNFRQAMEEGQISAIEFNKALLDLGTDPIAVEAAKSTKTFEGALGQLKAGIVDSFSNLIQAIGMDNITASIMFLADVTTGMIQPFIWFFTEIRNGNPYVSILATLILGLATGIGTYNAVMGIATLLTKGWATAQTLLNVAMYANPVGLIIAAIVALVALIAIAIYKYDEWGAALLQFLGPIGWVVNGFMAIKNNWDSIVNAFKTDGIIGGLKRIGVVLMDTFLKPLQQIFEMISEFDPTGIADSALNKIKSIRDNNNLVTIDEKTGKTKPMLAKILEDQQNSAGFKALAEKASLYQPKPLGGSTDANGKKLGKGSKKTKDDIKKVAGSANQVKKIDIKIDAFSKGDVHIKNESGKGMTKDQFEAWMKEMFMRLIIDAENA